MNSSKAAIVVSQIIEKLQLIAGIIITILFGLPAIACLFDKKTGAGIIIVMFILAALGVLLIVFSRKRKKLINDFKTYVQRLSVDPTGSIDNLAAGLGTSQDVVKNNLNMMIKKKYFSNAYIDTENNRVVFPIVSEQQQTNAPQASQSSIEYITITCKSCGGINKVIKGTVGECDYCGSPLS
jgi:uncharacterized protein with PQ loop repeat